METVQEMVHTQFVLYCFPKNYSSTEDVSNLRDTENHRSILDFLQIYYQWMVSGKLAKLQKIYNDS